MAIQSSGQIKISDLVTEFGGTAPHGLAEYYRGGGLCTNNNTNVPTSGEIKLTHFYSASGAITVTCSDGQTNLNASTLFGSDYTGSTAKILVIPSGAEIGATGSNRALTVPTGMAGTLDIQNSGTISGAGGSGGGGAGDAGGSAIYIAVAGVTVTNSGTIRGGGGGGGQGNNGSAGGSCLGGPIGDCYGGAGGAGGAGGNGQGYNSAATSGSSGGAGGGPSASNPNQGPWFCQRWGQHCWNSGSAGGTGGAGGSFGAAGSTSGNQAGGAGGKYIELASSISYTLSNTGTLTGNAP